LVGGRHDSIVSGVRLEVSRLFEDLGDLAGAEAGYRAAISDFREFENAFRLVVSLTYLGDLLQSGGRSTEAVVVLREAIDIRRRLDQRLGIATSLRGLGRALLDLSRWEEAKEALTESARLFLDVNEMPGYASALFALALVERSLGATDLSRRLAQRARQILLGLSEAERKSIGPTGPGLIRESEQLIASLDAQIS
jgi:tetratricopeptide (TPR) repeat protein